MVRKCCLCHSSKTTKPEVTLHCFPIRKDLQSLWKAICNLNEQCNVTNLFVCSNHFTPDDYTNSSNALTRKPLNSDAYPTVNVPSVVTVLKESPLEPIEKNVLLNSTFNIEITENNEFVDSDISKETSEEENLSPLREPLTVLPQQIDSVPQTPTKKHVLYEPRYINDITPEHIACPERAKRVIKMAVSEVQKLRKKNKVLNNQVGKLRKRVCFLKESLQETKSKRPKSQNALEDILVSMPETFKELIKLLVRGTANKYSPEIKNFSLNLKYYSPQAYEYVRGICNNLLPHPSTLRIWNGSKNDLHKNNGHDYVKEPLE